MRLFLFLFIVFSLFADEDLKDKTYTFLYNNKKKVIFATAIVAVASTAGISYLVYYIKQRQHASQKEDNRFKVVTSDELESLRKLLKDKHGSSGT